MKSSFRLLSDARLSPSSLVKRRTFLCLGTLGFVLFFVSLPGLPEKLSEWEWEGIGRIVAIGDVHGSYDKFLVLLQGTGLVDDGLRWIGARAHLVTLGDLVDRGQDDRKVLELVMRLQKEALSAGGRVHVLLGNHDIMVLIRDLRYVHKKSYADFVPDEDPEERTKAWHEIRAVYSRQGIAESKLRAAFEDTFPPGFFGFLKMFGPEGTFGKWLLTCPVSIKINGIVFVHGGLTEEVASLGLRGINSGAKMALLNFIEYSRILEPLVNGPATFEEIVKTAHKVEQGEFRGGKSKQQQRAAKELMGLLDSLILATDGPVWYRGNSLENEGVERRRIDDVLDHLQATTLVVGHTPTGVGQITSRFNARLFRVDVGKVYGRDPYCLEFEGSQAKVYNPQKDAYMNPTPESFQGQEWTGIHVQLSDRQVEEFLEKAKLKAINKMRIDDRSVDIVELERDGLHLRTLFADFDEKPPAGKSEQEVRLRRYKHEAAAYWLDRRLKLRMVPVTVIRKIKGKWGGLQVLIESAVDRVWVEEQDLLERVREELKEQIDKALVLEALLDVEERVKEGQMVIMEERRVMLSGSTLAFSHFPEIQKDLAAQISCPLNPALEYELRTLTREELKENLSKYLSDGQIDALIKRRDQILNLCTGNDR